VPSLWAQSVERGAIFAIYYNEWFDSTDHPTPYRKDVIALIQTLEWKKVSRILAEAKRGLKPPFETAGERSHPDFYEEIFKLDPREECQLHTLFVAYRVMYETLTGFAQVYGENAMFGASTAEVVALPELITQASMLSICGLEQYLPASVRLRPQRTQWVHRPDFPGRGGLKVHRPSGKNVAFFEAFYAGISAAASPGVLAALDGFEAVLADHFRDTLYAYCMFTATLGITAAATAMAPLVGIRYEVVEKFSAFWQVMIYKNLPRSMR
jgi:hypothetical protein